MKTKGLIYVSGPITASNGWLEEQNIRRAEDTALELWKRGYTAVCVHAQGRFYRDVLPASVWLAGDMDLLSRCDGVLFIPGWERSVGCDQEYQHAVEQKVPIYLSLEELDA